MPRLSVLLALLAAGLAPASARAFCPWNVVSAGCWDGVGFSSQEIGYSYMEGPWEPSMRCPVGCYYLPDGLLVANGVYGGGYCSSVVTIAEDYTLRGVSSTDSVEFFAELKIEAVRTGPGSYSGLIFESVPPWANAGQSVTVSDPTESFTVRLPLRRAPGEIIHLYFELGVSGHEPDGLCHATGHIRFFGLPVGEYVSPCRGNYEVPVPAGLTSWGRLKATYR